FVPVAPAVAWVKSCACVPSTLPLPEVKLLARFVVPAGPVIVNEPSALAAPRFMITLVLATVVVMLGAASLVPSSAPEVVAVTSMGDAFSTPTYERISPAALREVPSVHV